MKIEDVWREMDVSLTASGVWLQDSRRFAGLQHSLLGQPWSLCLTLFGCYQIWRLDAKWTSYIYITASGTQISWAVPTPQMDVSSSQIAVRGNTLYLSCPLTAFRITRQASPIAYQDRMHLQGNSRKGTLADGAPVVADLTWSERNESKFVQCCRTMGISLLRYKPDLVPETS